MPRQRLPKNVIDAIRDAWKLENATAELVQAKVLEITNVKPDLEKVRRLKNPPPPAKPKKAKTGNLGDSLELFARTVNFIEISGGAEEAVTNIRRIHAALNPVDA